MRRGVIMVSTLKGDKKSKIYFFGGKGGVGKTTCSAAFALSSARRGLRTLLVSTDPAHSTSDIFERRIGSEVANLLPGLDALEIDGERESMQYMQKVRSNLAQIVSPVIVEQINRQIDAAAISPGTEEAALFDRMVELINEESGNYDRLVFDTAPTGHTVRLLSLPDLLGAWLETLISKRSKAISLMSMAEHNGASDRRAMEEDEVLKVLRRRQEGIQRAKAVLTDESRVAFVFVINAEKLPIDETGKAVGMLDKYGIKVDGIIVNKVLPCEMQDDFWKCRKQQESYYLEAIRDRFIGKRIFEIPLMSEDMKAASLDRMADILEGFSL